MRFLCVYKPSKPEAVEYTRRFLEIAGDGECEIRQICEQPAHAGAQQ